MKRMLHTHLFFLDLAKGILWVKFNAFISHQSAMLMLLMLFFKSMERLVYHLFRQVLGAKLMELNSNLFPRKILFVKSDAPPLLFWEIPRFNSQIRCFFGRVVNPGNLAKGYQNMMALERYLGICLQQKCRNFEYTRVN